ncbi:MAG TPA: 2Fe-2S iron-sulfur cluster binding domain-containing protein, partial [Gammaproteobacteria bacterium]|nr:2Fe-2S iron-sulfur cluster binding domain-containing protein [Gammaproteobacteria bacterium]
MAYKVQVQPSGHTFICEAGESVLDAALRQGIGLSYGCRSGGCGACKGKVVAGQVDLGEVSPQALSEQEQAVGMALLCQARPDSDLVIEVAEALAGTAIEPRKLSAKVAKKELLADDVVRLMLRLPNNVRLPFFAGQYIDFLLPDGRRRSFSLANAPHDDEFLELHIRHVQAGEFTEYVLHDMKEKDIV